MEPILKINQVRSENENQLTYQVTITQCAEQIASEQDLLEQLTNTVPFKRGITSVEKISDVVWIITNDRRKSS